MKKYIKNNKGAVLIMVITIIGFMGVVMLFLSSASNTMNFQTNKVYLEACERNLTNSGLNWAKTNIKNSTISDFNDIVILDVNDMNIDNANLELKIEEPSDKQYDVQIKTNCGKARLNKSSNISFIVEGI